MENIKTNFYTTHCLPQCSTIKQNCCFVILYISFDCCLKKPNPSGWVGWGVDLWLLACWDCGFISCCWHGSPSLVSGVCCQVEVSGQADHSSRGVLPSVVCQMRVNARPHNGEAMTQNRAKVPQGGKEIVLRKFYKCFLPGYCKKQKTVYTPETFHKNVLK